MNSCIMLDDKDKLILEYLIQDCRISTLKLAKITKLSQPSIVYRISKLERENYILKYDILLDYNKFPIKLRIILVSVPKEKVAAFEKYCLNSFGIMTVFRQIHKLNYSLTTFATETELKELKSYLDLEGFYYEDFNTVKSYFPSFSIFNLGLKSENIKYTDEVLKLDLKDVKILEKLSNGCARDSILELSRKTGLSVDVVLYRYKKLRKAGYFPLYIAQINTNKFQVNYVMIHFGVIGLSLEKVLEVFEKIKKSIWFAKNVDGTYFTTFMIRDFQEYYEVFEKIYLFLDKKLDFLEVFPVKDFLFLNRINLEKVIEV